MLCAQGWEIIRFSSPPSTTATHTIAHTYNTNRHRIEVEQKRGDLGEVRRGVANQPPPHPDVAAAAVFP